MGTNVGDMRRITASFTDIDGDPIDSSGLTISIENPSGDTTAYVYGVDEEVIRDSLGVYHIDTLLDEAGIWRYNVTSTGAVAAVEEGSFNVSSNIIS